MLVQVARGREPAGLVEGVQEERTTQPQDESRQIHVLVRVGSLPPARVNGLDQEVQDGAGARAPCEGRDEESTDGGQGICGRGERGCGRSR